MSVDWQVETLRITVFPEHNASTSPSTLWDQFVGKEADSVQFERNKLDARQRQDGNRIVALVKQEEQIGWQFPIVPEGGIGQIRLPTWGSVKDEVDAVLKWSRNWLQCSDILPVRRLAFGAALLLPTLDETTAYKRLQQLFPRIDPENVSDFSYQINRRRPSEAVAGLQMNRLSRWNIATLERNVSSLDPIAETGDKPLERLYAVRVELDINTVPTSGYALPSDSLVAAFEELVEMGLEIARDGDVK